MGYGAGNVFFREDRQRWVAKYKKKVVYCKSESAAKSALRNLKKESEAPKIETGKLTVEQAMKDWLDREKQTTLKPSSFSRLKMSCENQVYPAIGGMQISALCVDDVDDMIADFNKAGMSHSTIKKAYEAVNGCMKYLVKKGRIPFNPIANATMPKRSVSKRKKVVCYTEEERDIILKEAARVYSNGTQVYRQGYAVWLLASTGIRVGEYFALTWDDVDFKKKLLHIRGNRVTVRVEDENGRRNELLYQDTTKTSSGYRTIPLNEKAITALNELKKINGKFNYIASSKNGTPTGQRHFDRMFREILTACGFPKEKIYGVHSLRHTFATITLSKGADVKKVSEILGHSDVTITYNLYVHWLPKDYSDVVALLD